MILIRKSTLHGKLPHHENTLFQHDLRNFQQVSLFFPKVMPFLEVLVLSLTLLDRLSPSKVIANIVVKPILLPLSPGEAMERVFDRIFNDGIEVLYLLLGCPLAGLIATTRPHFPLYPPYPPWFFFGSQIDRLARTIKVKLTLSECSGREATLLVGEFQIRGGTIFFNLHIVQQFELNYHLIIPHTYNPPNHSYLPFRHQKSAKCTCKAEQSVFLCESCPFS